MSLAAADNGDGLETGLAFGDVETFMLMRALFALVLVCCTAVASLAQETKVVALGITDHVVIREELQEGGELLKPKFNTPGVAYALIAHARKGDTIQVTLNKNGKPLMTNTRDLEA
ncbi:MAG: hypothetical protein ACREDO_10105, partial [Methyloceanibacter sp.]